MPNYRFRWTEIDYLEHDIEADSLDEAHAKFDSMDFTPYISNTEFGDGPYVEEIDA